jgi:holliday junction DNA helicase RuvA
MISSLRGTIVKHTPGSITIDVSGVGYGVLVPTDVWDTLTTDTEEVLYISTYVREDRLDLFGFEDSATRLLFIKLIDQPGIGPKTGLELCAVPRNMLLMAIEQQDSKFLTNVKGVGKKTAEKLLVELKSLSEKQPEIFDRAGSGERGAGSEIDQDAIEALKQLGFNTPAIMNALQDLPKKEDTTEKRVTYALHALSSTLTTPR